jgi:hypothetical protein
LEIPTYHRRHKAISRSRSIDSSDTSASSRQIPRFHRPTPKRFDSNCLG